MDGGEQAPSFREGSQRPRPPHLVRPRRVCHLHYDLTIPTVPSDKSNKSIAMHPSLSPPISIPPTSY
jgi:hypothetical protein